MATKPDLAKPAGTRVSESLLLIKAELMEYIDKHPYYPDFIKTETKQVIGNHFLSIGKILGLVELAFRRTYHHKDEIDPQYQNHSQ